MRTTVIDATRNGVHAVPDLSAVRPGPPTPGICYGQCWEDADVLLRALDVRPGQTCLSIASAGDNTLALLSKDPAHVIALDDNPAQLACLALRVSAYRTLSQPELCELMGSTASSRREDLYRCCRAALSPDVRRFWDARPRAIAAGIGSAGRFERYFALFRRYLMPCVHDRTRVERLLQGGTREDRRVFYSREWDTWRWRLAFRLFFSRRLMGLLARDPRSFAYVEGDVAGRMLERTRDALIRLDPADNPYLQWILLGRHSSALPYALRPEPFERIRSNLDRLEWRCQSLQQFLAGAHAHTIDRFNLSDVFEYLSRAEYHELLGRLVDTGRSGSRLAYWNMLVPRSRPACLAPRVRPLSSLADCLHRQDRAFFYSAFVVEEVL